MKTQSYKQKTHCTNRQFHRQSGFFLAVPVAGLALMLGVGGGIITSHKLADAKEGDVKETPVAESKMLPQTGFSALEARPVSAQVDYFDTVYFDTEG